MMTRIIYLSMSLIMLCMMTSCSAESYRYSISDFSQSRSKVLAKGSCSAEIYKALFDSQVYTGPDIIIPKDAKVFGALVVASQKELMTIPLYVWHDETGGKKVACRGPSPKLAQQAGTEEELIAAIKMLLGDTGAKN